MPFLFSDGHYLVIRFKTPSSRSFKSVSRAKRTMFDDLIRIRSAVAAASGRPRYFSISVSKLWNRAANASMNLVFLSKKRTLEILEKAKPGDKTSQYSDLFLSTLIILNLLALINFWKKLFYLTFFQLPYEFFQEVFQLKVF